MFDLNERELKIIKDRCGDLNSYFIRKEDNFYYVFQNGILEEEKILEFDGFNYLLDFLEVLSSLKKQEYDRVLEILMDNKIGKENYTYLLWVLGLKTNFIFKFKNENPENIKKVDRIRDFLYSYKDI